MKSKLLFLFVGALLFCDVFSQAENSLRSEFQAADSPVLHLVGKQLVKGSWSLGGTLSAKSNNYSHLDFLVADVKKYDQHAFNFRLEGSYFIKENLSTGLGLQYGEDKMDLLISVLNNSFERKLRSFHRSYGALGFIKNHIPVSNNNVFFITNQTELYYSYKNGPSETYVESSLERKYSEKHSVGVGIRPGILIFFTEQFAFDLNMGILGLSYSIQDVSYKYPPNNPPSVANQKEDVRNNSTDFNLKFDLLKLGFGFAYYF